MAEVRASRSSTDLRVTVQARQHAVMSDAGIDDGGTDQAPNPHELLAASLAACTSITVQMYADRKKWPLKGCDTTVRLVKTDSTPPKALFDITVSFQGELTVEQRERLSDVAGRCPVHKVLTGPIEVKLTTV